VQLPCPFPLVVLGLYCLALLLPLPLPLRLLPPLPRARRGGTWPWRGSGAVFAERRLSGLAKRL